MREGVATLAFSLGGGILITLLVGVLIAYPDWLPENREEGREGGGPSGVALSVRMIERWRTVLLVGASLVVIGQLLLP